MSLTKDGFYKSFSGAIGNNNYLLEAGGGHIGWGNAANQIPYSNGTVNSNLNADMLDGVHSTGFFRYEGWWSSGSGQNVNNAEGMTFVYSNHGSPSGWGVLSTFSYQRGSSYKMQLFSNGYTDGYTYYRNQSSDRGGWGPWVRLIDSVNWKEVMGFSSAVGSPSVPIYWTGSAFATCIVSFGNSSYGEHDANNINDNGIKYYTSNGPSTSLGATTSDGALYSQAYSTSWVAQIAQDYRNGGLYVRGKNNGTWQSWYRVWDNRTTYVSGGKGYIGGTEITQVNNSDTVDGWHGNQLVPKQHSSHFYPFVNSSYGQPWYKITLPWAGYTSGSNAWMMTTMEIVLGGSYSSGNNGRIYLQYYFYKNSSNGWGASDVRGTCIGYRLIENGVTIKYDIANPGIFYIKANANTYNSIGLENITANDTAPNFDFRNTTIEAIAESSVPSAANQTVPLYHTITTQNGYWANLAIQTSPSTSTSPTVSTIYASNWFRSTGATGWYSESYGGGIWMTDTSWVRTYGSKGMVASCFYATNWSSATYLLRSDGGAAAFNWSGQSGQPTWLWGGNSQHNYYVYNPSNFVVQGATWAHYLLPHYDGGDKPDPQTYFNYNIGVKVAMTRYTTIEGATSWCDTLWINGYTGGDVPNMNALTFFRNGTPRFFIHSQSNRATSYGTYYEVATKYNTYKSSGYGYLFNDPINKLYPIASNPDNSHPGYGCQIFYSWNTGNTDSSSSGWSNGITIGSHPSDQAYGFQIVQNMWDDNTYTRRYNSGWQSWRVLLNDSNYPNYCDSRYYRQYNTTNLNPNYGNGDLWHGYGTGMSTQHGIETGGWYHIWSSGWSDNSNWISQIAIPTTDYWDSASAWYRTIHGSNYGWRRLLDQRNYRASYGTTGGTSYIQIKINSTTSWMLSFKVRVYQSYQHYDIVFSGYNYGGNYWYSPQVRMASSTNTSITCYFGYDSAWNLWVGIPGASYTGVEIVECVNGYSQTGKVPGDLFTISNVSSFSGTVQSTQTAYAPWSMQNRPYWANIQVSDSASTSTWPTFGSAYSNDWWRSNGNSGWYSQSWGGGIWMYESSWIRTYGSKNFYVEGGNFAVSGSAGIGTTAPSYKLHVAGSAYVTDYMGIGIGPDSSRARLIFPYNQIAIGFRESSYKTSIQYMTTGNEALVFSTQQSVTSFIFKCGHAASNGSDWQSGVIGTPSVQIKQQSLYVNGYIANGANAGYNFYVGGTSYHSGNTWQVGVLYMGHHAGSWVSGMTTNPSIWYNNGNNIDASSYWAFWAMKDSDGNVVNWGGLGNMLGFHGYKVGRTDNSYDWCWRVNASNGYWEMLRAYGVWHPSYQSSNYFFTTDGGVKYWPDLYDNRYYRQYYTSNPDPITGLWNGYGVCMTTQGSVPGGGSWWHIFSAGWSGTNDWISQLALPTESLDRGVWFRYRQSSSTSSWRRLHDYGHTYTTNGKGVIGDNYVTTLPISGYSTDGLSFHQTSSAFDESNEYFNSWAHYIIANHGNGSSYYHYSIALPFWSWPRYKRQTGSVSSHTPWYSFITEENIGNYYWANIPVQKGSSTSKSPTFSTCYTSNWFRSTGATGWYSESYGGGIWMYDSTWIRTYGSKHFYVEGGNFAVSGNAGFGTTSPSYGVHLAAYHSLYIEGNESNAIYTEYHGNSHISTYSPESGAAIRHGFIFKWYDTYWKIGNVRGGSTNSAGFGIGYYAGSQLSLLVKPDLCGTNIYGKTENSDSNAALRVIKGWDCGNRAGYDTVVISSNDCTSLRLIEADGTCTGISAGDSKSILATTHYFQFYSGCSNTGTIYNGMGGTLRFGINWGNFDAWVQRGLRVNASESSWTHDPASSNSGVCIFADSNSMNTYIHMKPNNQSYFWGLATYYEGSGFGYNRNLLIYQAPTSGTNQVNNCYIFRGISYGGQGQSYVATCEGNSYNLVVIGVFTLSRSSPSNTSYTVYQVHGLITPVIINQVRNEWLGSHHTSDGGMIIRMDMRSGYQNYTTKTTINIVSAYGVITETWWGRKYVGLSRDDVDAFCGSLGSFDIATFASQPSQFTNNDYYYSQTNGINTTGRYLMITNRTIAGWSSNGGIGRMSFAGLYGNRDGACITFKVTCFGYLS